MPTPKTVKIFLAEGKPTGFKVIEVLGDTIQGFVIPRDSMKVALERDDLRSQGVYFLVGEDEEGNKRVYVGESESFSHRIRQHQLGKDFWNTAICFISKDDNLSKAHVKYLEAVLSQELHEAGRVEPAQKQVSKRSGLSEAEEAYVNDFAASVKLILSSLGYTFLKRPTEQEEKKVTYYCSGPRGADAQGFPTSEGFVILKGSKLAKNEVPSVNSVTIHRREELVKNKKAIKKEDGIELLEDVVYGSPSAASSVVLGINSNGWIEWKDKNGNKLHENEEEK